MQGTVATILCACLEKTDDQAAISGRVYRQKRAG
jgi:hypothetical protein